MASLLPDGTAAHNTVFILRRRPVISPVAISLWLKRRGPDATSCGILGPMDFFEAGITVTLRLSDPGSSAPHSECHPTRAARQVVIEDRLRSPAHTTSSLFLHATIALPFPARAGRICNQARPWALGGAFRSNPYASSQLLRQPCQPLRGWSAPLLTTQPSPTIALRRTAARGVSWLCGTELMCRLGLSVASVNDSLAIGK